MTELNQNPPATVPEQPETKPPVRKTMPAIVALVAIMALIGIANLSSLIRGNKKSAPPSAMPMRPSAPNAQQVTSFETQQQLQARRDAEDRQHQQELAAALQQLQDAQGLPGPEAEGAPPMTAAQRAAIYGDSPNARTAEASQAQAEAKQRQLARQKQQQDAINSDTVAIDFELPSGATASSAVVPQSAALGATQNPTSDVASATAPTPQRTDAKTNPMTPYDFDSYEGRLYRVYEGTVLEGVVTNHIDARAQPSRSHREYKDHRRRIRTHLCDLRDGWKSHRRMDARGAFERGEIRLGLSSRRTVDDGNHRFTDVPDARIVAACVRPSDDHRGIPGIDAQCESQ